MMRSMVTQERAANLDKEPIMKKSIIAVLAVSAISSLGSSAAFAHEDYSEGGALHWLEHVDRKSVV